MKYNLTDNQSGDTLTIDADREPTQSDADEIFRERKQQADKEASATQNVALNPLEKARVAGIPGPEGTLAQYAATHDPSQSGPPTPSALMKAINYNPLDTEIGPRVDQQIEEGSKQLQQYRRSLGMDTTDYSDPAYQFTQQQAQRELGIPESKKGAWGPLDVEKLLQKPSTPVGQQAVSGALDVASSFLTPLGIATLGMGALPKAAQKSLSLIFAAQMAASSPEIASQIGEEMGRPEGERDNGRIARLITQWTGTAAFAGLAAAHGLSPGPTIPKGAENAQAIRSDEGQIQVPRDVEQGSEGQGRPDIQQPTPRPPGDQQAPRTATAEQILLAPTKPRSPWRLRMADDGTFHIIDPEGNHVETFARDQLGEAKKRIDRLERGLDKPQQPNVIDKDEEEYLRKEAEGMGAGVTMTEASTSENEPFAGQVATINRKTGQIVIRPKAYQQWLKSVPEKFRDIARKSLLWEERLHLSNSDDEALGFLKGLSGLERRIAQRRYMGPGAEGKMSEIDLAHEALRYRQQQLMNMTPREVAQAAFRERWTLKGLDAVDSVIKSMREVFGHEGGDKIAQSIIDRMQENLNAAKSVIGAAPSAINRFGNQPQMDYNKLNEEEKTAYTKLHSDAMEARQEHEKNPSDAASDRLIDAEQKLEAFEGPRREYSEKNLPPPGPGERIVLVQKPDGSVYHAVYNPEKVWKGVGPGGTDVPMIGRLQPKTGWSHGMLGKGERILQGRELGHEPSARVKKGPKTALSDLDQPGFWPVVTAKGVPGAETVGPTERAGAAESGALPPLSARELEGHAANWMQPVVSKGQVPSFDDFVDYMKGKQPEIRPGQVTELWQKSVFDYLLKAPGTELSKLAESVYGKENIKGKARVVADPPTLEEMRNPERTKYQAGETIRSAQAKREKIITDLAYELVGPRLKDADLSRKTISPDELRYGGGKDISSVQDFTPRDEMNPNLLGKQLVDESRRSNRDPVSVTKRVTAMMDRRTGKVHLVSTFEDGRRGTVLYDPGALQHTPLKDVLKRYRVLSSYLLDEPIKDFHQPFDSLKDFNDRFGSDARRQYSAETSYTPPPVATFEAGVEGTPGLEGEGGYLMGPGAETGTAGAAAGKIEAKAVADIGRGELVKARKAPMTPQEASAMLDHVLSEQSTIDSPDDVTEAMVALAEHTGMGRVGRVAAAISGFAKLARAVQREYPDASIPEVLQRTANRFYAAHTEATSFDDFIARTAGRQSTTPTEAVRPQEPGREVTTIRTKAPTYDPNIVTGQGPQPEAALPPPKPPEQMTPEEKRALGLSMRGKTYQPGREEAFPYPNVKFGEPKPGTGRYWNPTEGKYTPYPDPKYGHEPSARLQPEQESERGRIASVTIALKDFLNRSRMTAAATGNLSDRLHQLGTIAKADYLQALPILRAASKSLSADDARALMKFADEMQVHGQSSVPLTDFQRDVYNGTIGPLMDANKAMFEDLRKAGVSPGESTYFARIVKDTHSLFENIRRGVRHGVVEGGLLGRTASFLKRRSMKVLVDDAGNRQVVSIKYGSGDRPGRVTAWNQNSVGEKVPTDMGEFKHGDMATNENRMQDELAPLLKKAQEFRNQIGYLESLRVKEGAEQTLVDKRIQRLRKHLADTLADQDMIRAQYDPLTLEQKTWRDGNGKRWRVTDGSITEIENASDVKYYHDPITTLMSQFLKLRQIHRAAKFLDDFKSTPEFRKIAAPIDERNVPDDWVMTQLPQLKGFRFEPRIAAELDKFHRERGGGDGLEALTAINSFLRDATFTLQPFIHDPNLLANFFFARGLVGSWANPKAWMWLGRTGMKAFVDVATKSPDYLKALRAGAPLLHFRMSDMINEYTNLLNQEFMKNPSMAKRVANGLGYANPLKLISSLGFHASWGLNDILTLQLINEAQARYGMDLKEAIHAVGKNMVDYRMPARLPDWGFLSNKWATALPRMLSNPNLMMFGRYHYGVLKTIGEQFKNVATKTPSVEAARSLDRIAAGVFLMAVAYPMLDSIIQKIGNDKKLKMRRSGVTTIPYNLIRMMRQEETPSEFIQSVFTPAIATKMLAEFAVNRDFRTGARIYNPSKGLGNAAKSIGLEAAKAIAPVKTAEDLAWGGEAAKAVGLSLLGITRGGQDDLQQLQSIAAKWNEKHGIEEPEILVSKDEPTYQKLRHQLANNDRGASETYKALLKSHTVQQVDKAMKSWANRPFTGSRKREKEFLDSLDADQMKLYDRAVGQRKKLLRQYYDWAMKQ